MDMEKRFLSVFLVLALSICLSLSVFAEEVPAGISDSKLSISASIGNVEQPLEESGVEEPTCHIGSLHGQTSSASR